MSKTTIFNHPLIQHKMTLIRSESTDSKQFRELLKEISLLMMYEATRHLKLENVEVTTPICKTVGKRLASKITVVPVLRAGLGMVEGLLEVIPTAKIGHLGLYRDHDTCQPVQYYCKMPQDIADGEVYVLDPMLATAGSMNASIDVLKGKYGVPAAKIRVMCLVAAPEGIANLNASHPDVELLCAQLDQRLNEHNYIVPGLGDAGDRIFGTK